LKESGHVAVVDYSQPDFPLVKKIGAERFLHDGGWDHTGRYFLIAANMRDRIAVIDSQDQSLVTTFETGIKPHPGRGANWLDPEYGWVNATVHMGEGLLAVYGADPQQRPDVAWQVVREVPLPAAGCLFLKTHDNSPWVLVDFPVSQDTDVRRQVCAYSKAEGSLDHCWTVSEQDPPVHFEFDKDGDEIWVSVWGTHGEIVIYDSQTLQEIDRLTGLQTPTGKFNVFNTANDVY
ncbi:MAG: cytochrome D1 domain-containing protein, partial [Persicimonas sp.]